MAMGVPHYLKDGTLHSGKTHTKSSKKLFHYNELSKAGKDKAKKNHDAFLKKKKKNGSKKITT